MACYHPWVKDGVTLQCGQCRGCRAAQAREWSLRCMHEASMHEENCFVTLTYDSKHLPPGGSLDRAAFPLFMKRLRKAVGKVRYFHVGEYGEESGRPHYHALLFGFDFSDKCLLAVRHGFPVWTSALLSTVWTAGLHELGSVTPRSAGYVSRYFQKRITGKWAKAKYGEREPEYGTMSRNPGIGGGWIDKYQCEVYPRDGVVVRGAIVRPPRYYDLRAARSAPLDVEAAKLKRFASRVRENESPERLGAAEVIHLAKDNLLPGGRL